MNERTVNIGQHQNALAEWRRIITHLDWNALPDLLVDEVTYHNPAQLAPLQGKDALMGTLKLVFGIFEDFEYTRSFSGEEGHVLEFRGRVRDAQFTGIDIVRFNNLGQIVDLVVMIRPIGAIMALGTAIEDLLKK